MNWRNWPGLTFTEECDEEDLPKRGIGIGRAMDLVAGVKKYHRRHGAHRQGRQPQIHPRLHLAAHRAQCRGHDHHRSGRGLAGGSCQPVQADRNGARGESAAFACQSGILQRALRCMSNGDRQQDDHLAGYEFGCHSNQRYRRLIALPGVATTTKAFAALAAGSNGPKLFPAEASSPAVLKAIPASSSFSNARHSG